MDRAEAIKELMPFTLCDVYSDNLRKACQMAIAALREQEQREHGCEYCNNTSTDILATTADGYAWLPKWANNYCPNCGAKMDGGTHGLIDADAYQFSGDLINEPTIDAVPVVRCKHCKHAVWDEEEQLWKCVISADWNEDIGEYVGFVEYHDADDFCSYGERRTNNVQET